MSPLHASSSPSSPHSRSPLPIDLVPGFVAPADGGAETCRGRSRCVHGGRRGGWGIRVAASTSRSSSSCSASPSSSTRFGLPKISFKLRHYGRLAFSSAIARGSNIWPPLHEKKLFESIVLW
ncbi:uncharacterized protein [Triticum aestivum]|uniref:uncharacterized protein n=1 Tax=Triticum aestivum TaxID=4565 RepID=UPI001D021E91|nr:uncharacterized protein LOC123125120 [Triticum aestivum]